MTSELDSTQTIMLDIPLEEKTIDAWLLQIKIRAMPKEARILIVQFDEQMKLDYKALQKYVNEVALMAPIAYIIFISSTNRYMGFITLEKFKALLTVNFPQITEGNVYAQLQLDKLSISDSKAKSALPDVYNLLVQNNLLGIPVLDEENHFLGMLERNKIEQAVVMKFLEKTAQQAENTPATI